MWYSRSEDRLKEWKDFRTKIGNLPFDEAVAETVHLWSFAPFVAHYLDHYDPKDWPSPWELLDNNSYDDVAKALGMIYTLYLSTHGSTHSFSMLKVKTGLENYNLVSIDEGKYILNYDFNEVISNTSLDENLEITKIYTDADLQLDKY